MDELLRELDQHSDPNRAEICMRFFKTGPGQYGEGDKFIGITMPMLRKVCKKYKNLPIDDLQKLLDSDIHEFRMAALVIMSDVYKHVNDERKQELYDLYIKNLKKGRINNWDLIDISCPHIVGEYALANGVDILFELARSNDLWQKRVGMVSTFRFLRDGEDSVTYKIAEILKDDKHDLIQKAVGWMLREAGKRVSEHNLMQFLELHAATMPRTELRYAIERLDLERRIYFMKKKDD